jgi:hypothetical protein
MAALVLVFCLASAPGDCQEERPLFADMSLMSCLVQGQRYASDWLADHPKWTLSGWRCEQNVPRQRQS